MRNRVVDSNSIVLCVAPCEEDAWGAAQMLADAYWNDVFDVQQIAEAHRGSSAWVCAHDQTGKLVASARAISDGVKHAWIYDVIVAAELRGSGVGAAIMRLLLDHPRVRGCAFVHLGTRDAQTFYQRLGFVDHSTIVRPYSSTTMTRLRTRST